MALGTLLKGTNMLFRSRFRPLYRFTSADIGRRVKLRMRSKREEGVILDVDDNTLFVILDKACRKDSVGSFQDDGLRRVYESDIELLS